MPASRLIPNPHFAASERGETALHAAPRWCNWNAPLLQWLPAGPTTDYDEATV